jgi:hypothetical protein
MSKVAIEGNALGSGTLTIAAPNTNSNFTLTLPTETGTIITNSGNQAGSFTTLNTSGAVVFNDAGADVDFRVEGDTNANLLIADAGVDKVGIGTNTFNTNGGVLQVSNGISFPATQSACADANTLDDYEEGTWTPTVAMSVDNGTLSYNTQSGYYLKIGSLVYVSFNIEFSKGTASGSLLFSGLPFTTINNQGARAGLSIGFVTGTTKDDQVVLVDTNTTQLSLRVANGSDIVPADLSATCAYWIGGTYRAA